MESARSVMIEATFDSSGTNSARRNHENTCYFKWHLTPLRLPLLTVAFTIYRDRFGYETVMTLSVPGTMMEAIVSILVRNSAIRNLKLHAHS